jgi:uncharacterized membrane-anchored protein YhcB (DUF1043 family)
MTTNNIPASIFNSNIQNHFQYSAAIFKTIKRRFQNHQLQFQKLANQNVLQPKYCQFNFHAIFC